MSADHGWFVAAKSTARSTSTPVAVADFKNAALTWLTVPCWELAATLLAACVAGVLGHTPGMGKQVEITVKFVVQDEELLMQRAREAIAAHGMGVELDGTLEQAIVEVLLHSNPGVESYDRYGLAVLD